MRSFLQETPDLETPEEISDKSNEINPERQKSVKKELAISPEKLEKIFLELSNPSPRYKFLRELPPEDYLRLLNNV